MPDSFEKWEGLKFGRDLNVLTETVSYDFARKMENSAKRTNFYQNLVEIIRDSRRKIDMFSIFGGRRMTLPTLIDKLVED